MTKPASIQKPTPVAGAFTKRIGSTTYRVGVHFSRSSKETAKDKIARLVRMEAQRKKPDSRGNIWYMRVWH